MMPNTSEAKSVEKLIRFALKNNLIEDIDAIYSRNILIDLLEIEAPWEGGLEYEAPETAAPILTELLDIAVKKGIIENSVTERDLFDTRLMNAVMPRPSEVVSKFCAHKEKSLKDATDWFYKLNNDCEYIRRSRIAKNIKWVYKDDKYGDFEVTINLSKPEKDPNEIKKLLNMKKSGYPACVLCAENMGYAGRLDRAARQTLRLIPFTLNREQWYMQYSPYVYFNEHCIVLKHEHSPMLVNRDTLVRLIEFVEEMPHYFLGSNAGLPIVGGSILNHDHYQGGRADLPMAKATIRTPLTIDGYPEIEAGVVNWPMNCIRLTSPDKEKLIEAAYHILVSWEGYGDESLNVINSKEEKHNAVTPYARMAGGRYQIDLVLRNNLTTEELPLGVYHPHPELHHIKKENIGLIEVMGLFILPGRLETELGLIEGILTGKTAYDKAAAEQDEKLAKHLPWIERLVAENGTTMTPGEVTALFHAEIGKICRKTLECSGVFKDTEEGNAGLMRFLVSAGAKKV
jgi:UDPglucose--hexose-1-phosphate uridylyltransferase